jgi:hypothetical protein
MKELEKDMTMLRAGMKEVGREIEFYRGQPVQHGDRSAFTFGVLCQTVQYEQRSVFRNSIQFARPSNIKTGRFITFAG